MTVFQFFRPIFFALDPEQSHRLTIRALQIVSSRKSIAKSPVLSVDCCGLSFLNPLGLAPGFDKNGEVPRAMMAFGFGHVEIGTVTPKPQSGNSKPRLFRLVEDEGVINRMGFNNDGQDAVAQRLRGVRGHGGILGVNIGANKDSKDRIADYVHGVEKMADLADYLTVNISSPNTPGLRGLQDKSMLTDLLDAVNAVRRAGGPPIFLKLAPDLDPQAIDDIAKIAIPRIDALIIGNTTIARAGLRSPFAAETGGLSGAPLCALAHQRLRDFRTATGGAIPLIAAGGIDCAAEAYARIKSGATLIQLYSALVYHGPGLAKTILRDLETLVTRDGLTNISQAIGVDAR